MTSPSVEVRVPKWWSMRMLVPDRWVSGAQPMVVKSSGVAVAGPMPEWMAGGVVGGHGVSFRECGLCGGYVSGAADAFE